MCNVSYGYMLEGVEKGRADLIKLLMSKEGISVVEAMEYLGVPADQHEQILALLSEQLDQSE